MQYWIMKSEPLSFSIDHLIARPKKTDHWDGVRNYQVRNMLRDQMKKGDLAFFYHSNANPPGIVGVVEIVKEGYPDHTAFDPEDHHYDPKSNPEQPRWYMVDVKFKQKFKQMVSLSALHKHPGLYNFKLTQKGNRLSIIPVTKEQWQIIMLMASN